jgi:hypothetical protein
MEPSSDRVVMVQDSETKATNLAVVRAGPRIVMLEENPLYIETNS